MFKSKINVPSKKAQVIIPHTSFQSQFNFCDYSFQATPSIPKEIMDIIQSINNNNELHPNPLLGSDSFTNVINIIVVMDTELGNYNNNDFAIDWYDVVDISTIP